MDPNKISAIIQAKSVTTTKALSCLLGQIRWHSRMLWYLADFAMPLHADVHRTPFKWTTIEEKAYDALKVMLTQALVVQPPDWGKPFHVFVDALEIAIGSGLWGINLGCCSGNSVDDAILSLFSLIHSMY